MLENLYLEGNEFEGPLPPSFANMSSLRTLGLSDNYFTGNFGSNFASLTSLEDLTFSGNQFQVPISFTQFDNLSNLKFVNGAGNKLILDSHRIMKTWVPKFQLQELNLFSMIVTNSLPLPNFLLYQYSLTYLDFTDCKLEGEFPSWLLENNTKMTHLFLTNCSLTGTFQLPSHPLLNLGIINVSDNAIAGQLPNNNISSIFPKLEYLHMSGNNVRGSIPREFGQMNSLITLDLSNNHLSGDIPNNMSMLASLTLSNNELDGSLFPALSTLNHLAYLFLDANSLSISIPSSFFNTSLVDVDISNNFLAGKLLSGVGNLSTLEALFLSNNNLEGSIPTDFVERDFLAYIDMSHNKLIGSVPSFNNSSVESVHLSSNRLSGLSKGVLGEKSSLAILDLSYNEINSSIHNLVQEVRYTALSILLLKGNLFTGHLSKELCQLTDLKILDLSCNNFNGTIPSCLGKIPFGDLNHDYLQRLLSGFHNIYYGTPMELEQHQQQKVNFTTKTISYSYAGNILAYMSGMDLSSNKLDGSIPSELGSLKNIRALNLSHNNLIGQIPSSFSKLVQIESLDLSFNKLSGNIPHQLTELTSLEVFSVAHNNLSGATPGRKGQFITFEESSYKDNPFLCGPPLPKSCNAILPNGTYSDGDIGNLVDVYVFWVSFSVSFAVVLYINPYWKQAWFYYVESVSTNCCYFIEDNLCKFSNIGNM